MLAASGDMLLKAELPPQAAITPAVALLRPLAAAFAPCSAAVAPAAAHRCAARGAPEALRAACSAAMLSGRTRTAASGSALGARNGA